ncbi:MAG TPA: sensor histidine kinase [Ruminiclostridium sp.]
MNKKSDMKAPTLKTRLISWYSVIIFISLLVLGSSSYYLSYKVIIQDSTLYNQHLTRQLCTNIDFYFDDMLKTTNSLALNSYIRYVGNYFQTVKINTNVAEIKNTLFNVFIDKRDIDDICILYNKKVLTSCFNIYSNEKLEKIADYYNIRDIYLNSKVLPFTTSNNTGKNVFSVVKSIYTPDDSNKFQAFVIVNFNIDKIDDIFKSVNLGNDSFAYIVDKSGNIQYSYNKDNEFQNTLNKLIGGQKIEKTYSTIEKINTQKFLISINPVTTSEMYVVCAVPLKNLTSQLSNIGKITIFLILFCTLLAVIISFILSSNITKPLRNLVSHMSLIKEGNFASLSHNKTGSYEIGVLYLKFDEMIARINRLMVNINEENRLKRKAELQALQAQINPHFLYNTLDSINSMAILIGAKDIMKMTTSLAKLMRLSISRGKEIITIKDELDHVRSYVDIQKIRYKDKFELLLQMDHDILECDIVKLVVQPLVENCIYHAFEKIESKGIIIIRGFLENENIKLQVIDNGSGINEEKLKKINYSLMNYKGHIDDLSIGIYNVNERLKLYYGEQYGINISSNENEGTIVEILIPRQKEGLVL